MTDVNGTIDWSKPIEAYHEDGRVVAVTLAMSDGIVARTKECPDEKETNRAWNIDGTDCCHKKLWRIRNVATQDIPEWAVDRACDLLLAEGIGARSNEIVNAFARYIAYHEEAPKDPAEELVERWIDDTGVIDKSNFGFARWLINQGIVKP